MKKTITAILTAALMASVIASCTAKTEPSRTSSTSRETTTQTTTATTTTQTTSQDREPYDPIRGGEHAITPEIEELYYEAFEDIDELPGTPVALIAAADDGRYVIVDNAGFLSYSGMDVYRVQVIGRGESGEAYFNTVRYVDVQVGTADDGETLNLPEDYILTQDDMEQYEWYGSLQYPVQVFHAAQNADSNVYMAVSDNHTGVVFIQITDDGATYFLDEFDYAEFL